MSQSVGSYWVRVVSRRIRANRTGCGQDGKLDGWMSLKDFIDLGLSPVS